MASAVASIIFESCTFAALTRTASGMPEDDRSHECWPPQPPATSNVRRPVSMAPTSACKPLRWSALRAETWNVKSDLVLAVETSTSPEKYQSKTSATPSFASDVPVERHRHDCDHLGHGAAPFFRRHGWRSRSLRLWRTLGTELPSSRNSTRPVSAAIGRATPGISLPDGRYIGADERCLLLVDRTFTAIGMTVLEVREGGC